ncbi:hypothetical protein ONJ16_27285, partial [Salmonella enterica subsp. enterica serovar Montevideo]|nr:hypothetical protein [Salmonella enterica subsp. enterica serovar Montevideo]
MNMKKLATLVSAVALSATVSANAMAKDTIALVISTLNNPFFVAEASCAEGETIHNMPGGATPDEVYAALLVADQYGQRFLQEW